MVGQRIKCLCLCLCVLTSEYYIAVDGEVSYNLKNKEGRKETSKLSDLLWESTNFNYIIVLQY